MHASSHRDVALDRTRALAGHNDEAGQSEGGLPIGGHEEVAVVRLGPDR